MIGPVKGAGSTLRRSAIDAARPAENYRPGSAISTDASPQHRPSVMRAISAILAVAGLVAFRRRSLALPA